MLLTQSLAVEIRDYIKNLLNKNVAIIDDKARCIAASEEKEVNSEISLPINASDSTSAKITNSNNEIFIPLRQQNKNVGYIRLKENSPELNTYIPLIKSFAELMIQQYEESNSPKLDSTDQLIAKIINNASKNEYPIYESEAKVLGYELSVKRVALVLSLKGFRDKCLLDFDQPSFEREEMIKNWKRNIESAINNFFTKNSDLLIAYIGGDKFLIYKSVETGGQDNLIKLLKTSYKSIFEPLKSHRISHVTVGFGNAYSGIEGLISAFREADLTLDLGEKIWGPDKSYSIDDLGILSIIGQGEKEKKLDFSNQLLGKLNNPELNKTLECFFENNLNLTETAGEMGIHRNTVIYRLNQITKTLNADPRIFEQAMSIKIALMIKSLFV